MTVTPAEAARTLDQKAARRHDAVEARAAELRGRLPAAAALLRERYAATEVWCFGSLAAGRPHATSDVDLAVTVLIPEYFRALADLADVLGCDVDLVELPRAQASLRERIVATGSAL